MRHIANASSKRALLGVAGMIVSLFLADGALVSASRNDGATPAGLVQAVQASAQVAFEGSLRFANDMRAVYQLTHLDEIVPQASEPQAPQSERANVVLCSESRPMNKAAKSSI